MKSFFLAFALITTNLLFAQMPQNGGGGNNRMQMSAKGIAKLSGTILDPTSAKSKSVAATNTQ